MSLFGKQEPETIIVRGQPLECHVCRHEHFWTREAQLNTAAATFFNMDWANESAVCIVCDNCGYIHWFMPHLMK